MFETGSGLLTWIRVTVSITGMEVSRSLRLHPSGTETGRISLPLYLTGPELDEAVISGGSRTLWRPRLNLSLLDSAVEEAG